MLNKSQNQQANWFRNHLSLSEHSDIASSLIEVKVVPRYTNTVSRSQEKDLYTAGNSRAARIRFSMKSWPQTTALFRPSQGTWQPRDRQPALSSITWSSSNRICLVWQAKLNMSSSQSHFLRRSPQRSLRRIYATQSTGCLPQVPQLQIDLQTGCHCSRQGWIRGTLLKQRYARIMMKQRKL